MLSPKRGLCVQGRTFPSAIILIMSVHTLDTTLGTEIVSFFFFYIDAIMIPSLIGLLLEKQTHFSSEKLFILLFHQKLNFP